MKIAIDGYEANVSQLVGIGQYAFQMLSEIYSLDKTNEYVIFLPSSPLGHLPNPRDNWRYIIGKPGGLWTIFQLPQLLKAQKCDLIFSPTHYLPWFSNIPKVMAVMDLSYLHYPKMFRVKDLLQLKLMGGYSIKQAQHILTISEFSKSEIVKYYNISPSKITVTYPGIKQLLIQKPTLNKTEMFAKHKIEQPFLLFVGTLQPRKNIVSLISAFESIKEDLQLVIVGKRGWLYEPILEKISKSKKTSKIRVIEYISDEELQVFYQNAISLVLPSLYEGFGIPVVEALLYGCPVVVSNTGSLPEVAGKAGIYVNPHDVHDIAEGIKKAIQLIKEEKTKIIKIGKEQAQKFSWHKSAKTALDVFENLYKSKNNNI